MNEVISVKNVSRSFRSVKKKEGLGGAFGLLFKPEYQEHHALKNANFTIQEGEFVGLIGANGAGKTTLLKILSGLIPPTAGAAQVLGYDPFKRPIDFRRRISLVMGQKAQLWWDLPANDAFELLQAIYEIPLDIYKKRLKELCGILSVERHLQTQIRRLSLGERMKMELIGALLHSPEVIFLDEPTIGLDVVSASNLREFLREYNVKFLSEHKTKSTMILTSHNMDDIEKLCARILILQNGELLFDGSPKKLMASDEKSLKVRFDHLPKQEDLERATSLTKEAIVFGEEDQVRFKVNSAQMPKLLQNLMGHFHVLEMGIEEQSLEDVIQRIFSK